MTELKSVSDWDSLGMYLQVPSDELERHSNDNQCWKEKMLAYWLENCKTLTWADVIKALNRTAEQKVADEIQRKYITITKGNTACRMCVYLCLIGSLSAQKSTSYVRTGP